MALIHFNRRKFIMFIRNLNNIYCVIEVAGIYYIQQ